MEYYCNEAAIQWAYDGIRHILPFAYANEDMGNKSEKYWWNAFYMPDQDEAVGEIETDIQESEGLPREIPKNSSLSLIRR